MKPLLYWLYKWKFLVTETNHIQAKPNSFTNQVERKTTRPPKWTNVLTWQFSNGTNEGGPLRRYKRTYPVWSRSSSHVYSWGAVGYSRSLPLQPRPSRSQPNPLTANKPATIQGTQIVNKEQLPPQPLQTEIRDGIARLSNSHSSMPRFPAKSPPHVTSQPIQSHYVTIQPIQSHYVTSQPIQYHYVT